MVLKRGKLERVEKKLRRLLRDILRVKMAVNLLMRVVNKKSVRSGKGPPLPRRTQLELKILVTKIFKLVAEEGIEPPTHGL